MLYLLEENAYYFDDHSTIGEVEGMAEILVLAIHRTYSDMVSELGPNMTSWMYGNHHIIYIDHLASLTYIGGDEHRGGRHTLNVAGGWSVGGGPSRRMVVNFDDTGKTVNEINNALLEHQIFGGKDLSTEFPEFGNSALYCITEIHTREHIDRLLGALKEVIN